MSCQKKWIKVNSAKGKGPARVSAHSWSAGVTGLHLVYDHILLQSTKEILTQKKVILTI